MMMEMYNLKVMLVGWLSVQLYNLITYSYLQQHWTPIWAAGFTEGSKVSAIERNCVWSRKYENLVNQPFDSSPKELLIGVDFKLRVQHLAKVTESVGSVVTRGFRHSPEIWRICTGTVHQFCSRGADKDPDEWSLSRQFHFAVSVSVMEGMIVTSGSVGRQ